jgi:hypothetical protein
MERYEALKGRKGSGKSIIATARKVAVIIWHMLSAGEVFKVSQMVDRRLAKKAESMSRVTLLAGQAGTEQGESSKPAPEKKVETRKTGVTGRKRKKVG